MLLMLYTACMLTYVLLMMATCRDFTEIKNRWEISRSSGYKHAIIIHIKTQTNTKQNGNMAQVIRKFIAMIWFGKCLARFMMLTIG